MDKQYEKRFIIVGAGPAGIHMAYSLLKKGFHNITILEATDHIGGKCCSVSLNGQIHEMGATYLHIGYRQLIDLIKELKLDNSLAPIFSKKQWFIGKKPDFLMLSAKQWLRKEVRKSDFLPEPRWLPVKWGLIRLIWLRTNLFLAILKYNRLHKKIFGKYKMDFLPKPDDAYLAELKLSVKDFLIKNNLAILIPFFKATYVSTGYNFLENIPALYGLWFINPIFLKECFMSLITGRPVAYVFKKGYQSIWKTIVEQHQLNVLFNINITEIIRNQTQASIVVKANNTNERFEFLGDEIILTPTMRDCLHLFKEPSQNEINAFTKQKTAKFITSIVSCAKDKRLMAQRIVFPNNLNYGTNGTIISLRNSVLCTGKAKRISASAHQDKIFFVALQYVESETNYNKTKIEAALKNELQSIKLNDIEVHLTKEWSYFPHYQAEQIQAGYPWKVLDFQGENHTWYAGSSVCFESVLSVMSYNNILLPMILEKISS